MKICKMLLIFFICLAATALYAEEENRVANDDTEGIEEIKKDDSSGKDEMEKIHTITGKANYKKMPIGAYGGIDARYGMTKGGWDIIAGVRFALIFKHYFAIGCAGYGLGRKKRVRPVIGKELLPRDRFDFQYGGGLLGFHLFPLGIVHVSTGVLIGGGRMKLESQYFGSAKNVNFFLVEPELCLYINLSKNFRFGIIGSYRIAKTDSTARASNNHLQGVSIGLLMQGGIF